MNQTEKNTVSDQKRECACHERGWQNKWECAVEMAARAEAKLDRMIAALARIEDIYCDGDDTHDDWRAMGEIARAALNEPHNDEYSLLSVREWEIDYGEEFTEDSYTANTQRDQRVDHFSE